MNPGKVTPAELLVRQELMWLLPRQPKGWRKDASRTEGSKKPAQTGRKEKKNGA